MSDVIRVAMLSNVYYPHLGGVERQLAAVNPLLQEQGMEIHVVTRQEPGLPSHEYIGGVAVHRLPVPGPKITASLAYTLQGLRLLRSLRPHLIHSHIIFSATTTAVVAKWMLGGIPVVTTLHRSGTIGDVQRLQRKFLGNRRLALFGKQVDAFVCISNEIRQELTESGVPAERQFYIPNGVDTARFKPLPAGEKQALRASFNLPDGPVAVFTGRLAPEKRVHHLLTIWPAIRQRHPNAQLLVLGSGPEEATLKARAGEGVNFLGLVDDVVPYLQAADFFLLPSIGEGLSVAMLEAMAAGLPPIITSVGGATDVILSGKNGILVDPDDPEGLQEAILSLLQDERLRAEMARQARKRIECEYSLQVVVARLRSLYDQLLHSTTVESAVTTGSG